MPRETFAKGLKKYSFNTIEDELQTAWSSIYRYWWSFMCCSRDYWWVCHEKGNTLDPALKRVYDNFGDKCHRSFSQWWMFAARDNFREEFDPPRVFEILKPSSLTREEFESEEWMTLRVPLNLKEEKLVEDFVKILRSHPNRVYTRKQTSKYPLTKFKHIHEEVLERTCLLWHAVNSDGGLQPGNKVKGAKDSYYEVGVRFDVNPDLVIKDSDPLRVKQKKRNAMKVAVLRMLQRAERLIENVEIGRFPCIEPVEKVQRWTAEQELRMQEAIARGEWKKKFMTQSEWAVEFAAVHRAEELFRQRQKERIKSRFMTRQQSD